MFQFLSPALLGAAALLYAAPAACATKSATVQPLTSVAIQNQSTDWKQANQKVAELGGWKFYASETADHQGMDHSKHSMPEHHSGHSMPMDHSGHQRAKTGDEHEHHH